MLISYPAALVSSTELSPDQQTWHILHQQSPKGQRLHFPQLSSLTALLCIHFHFVLFYFKSLQL